MANKKIGVLGLGIWLCVLSFGSLAQARTLPTDIVRIIKTDNEAAGWTMYDKKFAELKFDAKTINKIKAIENELAASESPGPGRYHLTNVRIFAEQVQYLIFRTDYGDTVLKQIDDPSDNNFSCYLTFSGNGFSKCTS